MSGNVDLYTHLDAYLSQCGPSPFKDDSNLDNHHNLQFLDDALKDVTVHVSFWGTRYLTKPGYRDSVNLRWLACKVHKISVRYPPAVIPLDLRDQDWSIQALCSTPERRRGFAVQQKVRHLFAGSDEMLKNSFFARIFSAIREVFVYDTSRFNFLGFNVAGDPLSPREARHLCPTPTFIRGQAKTVTGVSCWNY